MTTPSNSRDAAGNGSSSPGRLGTDAGHASEIATTRLHLRMPRPDDAPALFSAYTADAQVTKYLIWAPHKNVGETTAFIDAQIVKWETGEAYSWTISVESHQGPIGMIELRPDNGSIGYVLGRAWWNRGFMSEALQAVVNYASTTLRISTLRAWCDAENRGSARVLEKSGFRIERTGPAPLPHAGFGNAIRPALFYVRSEGD